MRKCVFTLCVDDYDSRITDITFPLMQRWAEKIGASFYVIRDRRFPEWPVVYEKLQVYQLGREMANDWNIFFDADAMVHPDTLDFTNHLPKDTVMHNGRDVASNRWNYDEYFWRDGRHIGACNWMAVASDWCLDLWHPLEDLTLSEAVKRIHPIVMEGNTGITAEHLIDDFTLSRNIARYGLKFTTFPEIWRSFGQKFGYLWHQFMKTNDEKLFGWEAPNEFGQMQHVRGMYEVLEDWAIVKRGTYKKPT